MKNKSLLAGLCGLAMLSATSLSIAQHNRRDGRRPGDPPVVILGGSIRAHSKKVWTSKKQHHNYSYQATNNTSIYTIGVYDASGTLLTSPISAPNGFKISLFDTSTPPQAGVGVCSSADCSISSVDGSTVYIVTLGTAELEEAGSNHTDLHYHSLLTGCDLANSTYDKGPCNHIGKINIDTGAGPQAYDCGGHDGPYKAGKCSIGIGGPPPAPRDH